MRFDAVIAGVGMTRFAKHPDRGLKDLGAEAVTAAVTDAGIALDDLEAAFVGNAAAGLVTGQESVRGQVVLSPLGVGKIPIINVENACASGSTALHQACVMVTAGMYDVVLALGVEKLTHPDKMRSFAAFAGAMDVDELAEMMEAISDSAEKAGAGGGGAGENRSRFMDVYAMAARNHMERYGTTRGSSPQSLPRTPAMAASILSPSSARSSPVATCWRTVSSSTSHPFDVSPIGDGAAAAVVMSPRKAAELGQQAGAGHHDGDALRLEPRRGRTGHRAALRGRRLRGGRTGPRRSRCRRVARRLGPR